MMLAIQEYAMDLLLEAHQTELPIDIASLVQHLDVRLVPYSKARKILDALSFWEYAQTVKGLSFQLADGLYVCYSDRLSLIERRSVIMHELGHIYLKHLSYGGILGKSASKAQEDAQEQEANTFALCALAPLDLLMRRGITSSDEIQRTCRLSAADARIVAAHIAAQRKPKFIKRPSPALICIIVMLVAITAVFSSVPRNTVNPPSAGSVYVTKAGSCYHRSDCYQIVGSETIVLSEEAAIGSGYEPCKSCHPEK